MWRKSEKQMCVCVEDAEHMWRGAIAGEGERSYVAGAIRGGEELLQMERGDY